MTRKGITTSRPALGAAAILLALVAVLSVCGPAAVASAGGSTAQINGDGSSWAANAILQWIADVQKDGLQIVFTSTGSAQGRQDFAAKTVDYAISDIGYQGVDPLTGQADTSEGRTFAYLPIVAGGTAFPYQIRVAGRLVTNLRLSGLTLAKIFTNQITNWDDPEVTADNNGRQLPSTPIIPVVHSEGAGTTAQFTAWLAAEYPSIWKAYSKTTGLTEYWPRSGVQISQDGSDGVMTFVASSAGNGSIGLDEYSYPLGTTSPAGQSWPVAKVENAAGYFTLPTQYNVAVALTQAQINMNKSSPDYLLQTLTNVYDYTDPRTYPLSSYSYMIEPTASNDATMTTAKRQTLANWMYYSICQGQAEIGPIGYSPLPINLVEASFQQIALLHGADPNVDLTSENVASCHNPTFEAGKPAANYLAQIAPQPPSCDKSGEGPCTGTQGQVNGNPVGGKPPSAPTATSTGPGASGSGAAGSRGSGASSASGSAGGSGGGTSSGDGSGGSGPAAKGNSSTQASVTGNSSSGSGSGGSSGAGSSNAALIATPTVLGAAHTGGRSAVVYAVAGVVVLLLALAVPPALARRKRKSP